MKKMHKIGIIGCGGIANGKHMPNLAKIENVEMVAFCDIIEEKAIEAKEKYGTPNSKVYTDYKQLLSDKEIDIVHVCTPNRSHSFITVDALEAGKNVMCEKPMAINSAEAQKMLDAYHKSGKKLTIGYQTRQRLNAKYLKSAIEHGEIGEVYYANAIAIRRRAVPTWGVFLNEYEQGGGPLIDIGTHALDLTLWLMNNYKPKMVVGKTFRKLADNIGDGTGNAWGDWDPEKFTVEDSAFGFIIMENGAVVNLESAWALNYAEPKEATCILCGDKGGCDTLGGEARINGVKYGKQYIETQTAGAGVAFFDASSYNNAFAEAQQWIDAIDNDTDPCVLPEQSFVVTQILEAIYESEKTGKPVYFN